MTQRIEPLEDLVGDLFVDRHFELNLIWEWGSNVPPPSRNSIALIGRRRTGKTSILTKAFNRLFYEQTKVMPVFISFASYLHRKKPITSYEFAREYMTGYVGSYLAFRYRKPELLNQPHNLRTFERTARVLQDEYALELIRDYRESVEEAEKYGPYGLMKWVINFPMGQARFRNMPTAIMIDEFQVLTEVYNPYNKFSNDLTNSFQRASETKWAPLFVSGSSISLLVGQALGGLLSGRFKYWYLKPLSREYAYDLLFRLGNKYQLGVDDALAEAIWQLTAGYPYPIECLMTSFCTARHRYPSLDALDEVVTFELTNPAGLLWQHYSEEFDKYSELLNQGQTTKKVLFWATKYPDKQIDAEQVAKEIGIEFDKVQAALCDLHQVGLVEKIGLTLYQGLTDPMLQRYIEYNHQNEIQTLTSTETIRDWKKEYYHLADQLGHLLNQYD